jgi:beta-glucosidase
VRDPVAAANAGLDLPGLAVTEGRTAEDFTSGRIPARRLDEIVRRTLFAIFDAGLVEHPLPEQRPALASTPEHVALATRIATNGMVLLVNRDSLLPLDAGQVGSVAVIGTARDDAQWVMAGSPCVRVSPDRLVTPLEGIRARAGAVVRVAFSQGSVGDGALPVVPAEVLRPIGREGAGLLGEYWNAELPDGEPAVTVVDPTVDISQAPEGVAGPVWSARWTGTITPSVDGPHRFTILAAGISRLVVDGTVVAAGEREFGQVFDGPPLPVPARSTCGPATRSASGSTTTAAPPGPSWSPGSAAGTSGWDGSHRTRASRRPRSWPPAATSPWCSPATPWARGWTAPPSPSRATRTRSSPPWPRPTHERWWC